MYEFECDWHTHLSHLHVSDIWLIHVLLVVGLALETFCAFSIYILNYFFIIIITADEFKDVFHSLVCGINPRASENACKRYVSLCALHQNNLIYYNVQHSPSPLIIW